MLNANLYPARYRLQSNKFRRKILGRNRKLLIAHWVISVSSFFSDYEKIDLCQNYAKAKGPVVVPRANCSSVTLS